MTLIVLFYLPQIYLERVAHGQAACVYDLCITPTEFKARLGDFSHYCPVSLASGELVDCSVTVSLKYSIEFRGLYLFYLIQKANLLIKYPNL